MPLFAYPVFAKAQVAEYLCELGATFYKVGRYEEALLEFKKVLMLEPNHKLAQEYVNKIFQAENPAQAGFKEESLERPARDTVIEQALGSLAKKELTKTGVKQKAEKVSYKAGWVKSSGETQMSLGVSPKDAIWKQANADLNERNWRMLSDAAFNQRENTFDARVYDRLRVNLDTNNKEGFGFHSNITVDPWSFTGKSQKITVCGGTNNDCAEVELKYWSNTGYTINETVYTLEDGASISFPEIKVEDWKTGSTPITTTWGAVLNLPALNIKREFQPLRELWFDYVEPDNWGLRFFPLAYQDQALTSDDPLMLSNNHTWWEESPWLDRWLPGRTNSGASPVDFTKGEWDDSLSFFTRDSDGTRLTALRGLSFDFTRDNKLSLESTFASPKGLWQDYDSFDNLINSSRFKYYLLDNLTLGSIYTYRLGFNEENKRDIYNHTGGVDFGYEPMQGLKLALEVAASELKQDLTSSTYASKSRGNAYFFSLTGTFPKKSIMDLKYGYAEIKPKKSDNAFLKYRLLLAHMDEGFSTPLSNYRETRDDNFWSRHIHFRQPFKYYYSGLYFPKLRWDDIEPYSIGNGIDVGRDVIGFRLENALWEQRLENIFDVRNVHNVNGKFMENVSRGESTYKVNDNLTTKLLGIYHKLPKTKGGTDPFIFDPDTGIYMDNTDIADGKDPTLKTGSLGLEYAFTDWLALSGIWERTNDYTLAYDNYPRDNLNSTSFSTYGEYGNTYRTEDPYLYSQSLFPLPPYPFYNIFKSGLKFNPLENLQIYLDYARNEFKSAGQVDDNINHVGIEMDYSPSNKFDLYLRYTYARWNDLTLMRQGYSKYYLGRHNFFGEFRYAPSQDDEFIFQYGESGRSPITINTFDPFGGSIMTLDTRHIVRIYYRRKF